MSMGKHLSVHVECMIIIALARLGCISFCFEANLFTMKFSDQCTLLLLL